MRFRSGMIEHSEGYDMGHREAMKEVEQERRAAKIDVLNKIANKYAKYTWGHYDPFTIIKAEIDKLREKANK